MNAPEWMNWPGWNWVAFAGALVEGLWFGWYCRGVHERHKRWREAAAALARMEGNPK